jgi:hypothetical protein
MSLISAGSISLDSTFKLLLVFIWKSLTQLILQRSDRNCLPKHSLENRRKVALLVLFYLCFNMHDANTYLGRPCFINYSDKKGMRFPLRVRVRFRIGAIYIFLAAYV